MMQTVRRSSANLLVWCMCAFGQGVTMHIISATLASALIGYVSAEGHAPCQGIADEHKRDCGAL